MSEESDDLRGRILLALIAAETPIAFKDLVVRVTPEGECLDCARSKVRKVVNRLVDEGEVAYGLVEG